MDKIIDFFDVIKDIDEKPINLDDTCTDEQNLLQKIKKLEKKIQELQDRLDDIEEKFW